MLYLTTAKSLRFFHNGRSPLHQSTAGKTHDSMTFTLRPRDPFAEVPHDNNRHQPRDAKRLVNLVVVFEAKLSSLRSQQQDQQGGSHPMTHAGSCLTAHLRKGLWIAMCRSWGLSRGLLMESRPVVLRDRRLFVVAESSIWIIIGVRESDRSLVKK